MMWKLVSRLVPPGKLTVLFFHRVFARRDELMPGEPTAKGFDRLLGWLQTQYTMLPLDEAVRRLKDGSLPPAAAAITFDDGYRDNFEVAAPLLKKRGVPATFFIASGFLDGGIMWNDVVAEAARRAQGEALRVPELSLPPLPITTWGERGQALTTILQAIKYLPLDQRSLAVDAVARASGVPIPRDLMMTSKHVRALAREGFTIGAHTVNHPILTQLPDRLAAHEIVHGRDQLESLLGRRVSLFAYPHGRAGTDYDARHVQMVRSAGFDAAFSTEPGVGHRRDNFFELPRFTPWDRHTERRFRLQLVRNQWRRAPRSTSAESTT
jgi:peptidoglycan/xylan/chitin deacetylase (PgdA/CDA1 family)